MLWAILALNRRCHCIDKTKWMQRRIVLDILLSISHPFDLPFLHHSRRAPDKVSDSYRVVVASCPSLLVCLGRIVARLSTRPFHTTSVCGSLQRPLLFWTRGRSANQASHRWMEEHALASPSEGLMEVPKKCVASQKSEGRDVERSKLTWSCRDGRAGRDGNPRRRR